MPEKPTGPFPNMEELMKRQQAEKLRQYRELNRFAQKGGVVLTGSSLMEQFPVNELMMSKGIAGVVYNRGFGGFTTEQYLGVLDCVTDLEPKKLFINIGTNDLNPSTAGFMEKLLDNYREILIRLRAGLPDCDIVVMAYYPVACDAVFHDLFPGGLKPRDQQDVLEANRRVKALAGELGLKFIDMNHAIADEDGYMKAEYAIDGIHMYASAYAAILEELKAYF